MHLNIFRLNSQSKNNNKGLTPNSDYLSLRLNAVIKLGCNFV
jgi:hypothetical protein